MMMKDLNEPAWIDISLPLQPGKLVVWPGDPPLRTWLVARIDPGAGSSSNVTAASLSLHSGTHIDAPCHYLPEGKGIEGISLEACLGPARLLRHTPERHIAPSDLDRGDLGGVERVLFRTANSDRPEGSGFREDYVALGPEAACLIVEKGIRLVGIDGPSIGPPGPPGDEVHRILLGSEIVVLEGLALRGLQPGDYELAALPLLVPASDGSPVRAAVRPLGKTPVSGKPQGASPPS